MILIPDMFAPGEGPAYTNRAPGSVTVSSNGRLVVTVVVEAQADVKIAEVFLYRYRWSEDGPMGIFDDHRILCFALALWNCHDLIQKVEIL